MKRFIILNEQNIVISVRYGKEAVLNEIESEHGDVGQMLKDGSFIDVAKEESNEITQLDRIEATLDLLLLKQEGIII